MMTNGACCLGYTKSTICCAFMVGFCSGYFDHPIPESDEEKVAENCKKNAQRIDEYYRHKQIVHALNKPQSLR